MSDYNREEQLKCLHRQRRAATEQKVNDTIDRLLKLERPINFKQVSELSGISVATLYKHENIKQRIVALRSRPAMQASTRTVKSVMGDSSKDAIIASLKRRIGKLEQENTRLYNQLKSSVTKDWEAL